MVEPDGLKEEKLTEIGVMTVVVVVQDILVEVVEVDLLGVPGQVAVVVEVAT
jgi:hypothetical protein